MALKSVIALSKNQLTKAENLALQAAKRNPESAIAKIALSYIYQARFDIDKALLATQQATQLSPENALAWARLAELRLASGNRSGALKAAENAQNLNPKPPRTQTVLGFVFLAQINIGRAHQSFSQAIMLDPSDPLTHLGLGLVKIRSGQLEQGTRELETAANLDPNNAIIRSYLGKAYYELKNENFAETEFSLAKEMDPNDPTPWFYDAILKQTQNRPIEALHDMQKAIELNNNRGIYRSRLLLDEDLAARSASLGRIYNDLGFQQLGLVEGWKSVTIDPANYSAHRLLADNYSALPRHEIARVSALLQSQLLQPINITPIQPRLAESDRLASNTLGSTSFNEYNSLFERNQFTLQGAGIVGNKGSYGEELVHAGIWNKLSYSIGQYHFQSDGIRKNNAIKQDIYNAFVQYQLTDKLNLQFEYRYNFLKNGDLSQYFNHRLFSNTLQEKFKRQLYRVGGHYQPDPTLDILFSGIYTKDDFSSGFTTEFAGTPLPVSVENNADTFSIELQMIKDLKWVKFIAGAGYINNNQPQNVLLTQKIHFPGFFIPGFFNIPAKDIALEINTRTDHDSDHINAYLYSFLTYKNLTAILGVSFDSIENHTLPDIQRFNPKLGLLWNLFDNTTLRAAYFQGVKKTFSANQTIEPAQIAGFVQFFDDDSGTKYEHFGLGLDHKFNQSIYFGAEGTYRKLKVPVVVSEPDIPLINDSSPDFIRVTADSAFIKYERQHEFTARSYFNWTPTKQISASIEYQLVILDRQISKEISNSNAFLSDIITHQVPISLNFFAANGLYSKFRATFVKQRIRSDTAGNSGHEHFWSIDALIGYKFPQRYGRAEFGIKNLLNENYQYADRNLITGLPSRARFLPERTLFGQVIFDFDVF
jgi:tetratricopeptide (TPR) repeat protein